MMLPQEVVYLGPRGSYTYVTVIRRYGEEVPLVPKPRIPDVFESVRDNLGSFGVVPLENSSGGLIEDTVDCLGEEESQLRIKEELRLYVQLALLGHRGDTPGVVYSHFAPLRHCQRWLQDNLSPGTKWEAVSSTTAAVEKAVATPNAAALAHPMCASLYGLEVLHFPVNSEVDNLTQFAVIGHGTEVPPNSSKSSYLVELVDEPASLSSFLSPFGEKGVNLTRIHSRPVKGNINRYKFFITIDGSSEDEKVKSAWQSVKDICVSVQDFGSYPVSPLYTS